MEETIRKQYKEEKQLKRINVPIIITTEKQLLIFNNKSLLIVNNNSRNEISLNGKSMSMNINY